MFSWIMLHSYVLTWIASIFFIISIIGAEIFSHSQKFSLLVADFDFSFWFTLIIIYPIGLTILGISLYIFTRFYWKITDDNSIEDRIVYSDWLILINLLAILVAIISIFLGTVHAKWSNNRMIEYYKNKKEKEFNICENPETAKIMKEIDKNIGSYWDKICP